MKKILISLFGSVSIGFLIRQLIVAERNSMIERYGSGLGISIKDSIIEWTKTSFPLIIIVLFVFIFIMVSFIGGKK